MLLQHAGLEKAALFPPLAILIATVVTFSGSEAARERLYCFDCFDCFIPYNLIKCPARTTKCYFEHSLTAEGEDSVARRCFESTAVVEDECAEQETLGKKVFACACSFNACNAQNIFIGPRLSQRYYQLPKTLSGVDFPGWKDVHMPSTAFPRNFTKENLLTVFLSFLASIVSALHY